MGRGRASLMFWDLLGVNNLLGAYVVEYRSFLGEWLLKTARCSAKASFGACFDWARM